MEKNKNLEELSSLGGGGDGSYNTPKAARPKKSKDENSPTGFESSPKPNMYTKTMKFRIVDPKDRINSKDLWSPKKGQPKFDSFPHSKKVYEIKVNKPNDFSSKVKQIQSLDIKIPHTSTPTNDGIIVSFKKPCVFDSTLEPEDSYGLFKKIKIIVKENPFAGNFGGDYIFDIILKTEDENIYVFGENFEIVEDIQTIKNFILDIEEYKLNEVRYSKFKKNTAKRTPQEQLHMAVKEIQMKMDEVNRLVDFTSKMKQELREDDSGVKYLKRTKNSIGKIQEKIQHINNKIKNILE